MGREHDRQNERKDRRRDRSPAEADRRSQRTRDHQDTSRRRRSKSRENTRDREHKRRRSDSSSTDDGSRRDEDTRRNRSREQRRQSRSRSGSVARNRERRQRRGDERSDSREKRRGLGSLPGRKRRWGPKAPETSTEDAAHDGTQTGKADNEPKKEDEKEETEPLPVTLFKDALMKAVRASQVLVCTGETGSGKTTQIPQYLLELVLERDKDKAVGKDNIGDAENAGPSDDSKAFARRPLQIAVTQPRRVAATSVAKRVADERNCRVGEEVGYSIRFEDRTGPSTRIKYCTDGVLVRECLEDPYLRKYGVVMLDEAHERSIDTDVLFGLLKRALAKRPDLHAVITSATLDVERFAAFFGNCPFIQVPGRTHAVDVYHSKTRQVMTANGPASPRYVEDAVEIILKVHRTQGPGHVLAFFTGQDEIERVCRLLREAMAQQKAEIQANGGVGFGGDDTRAYERPQELLAIPLFGALSAEAQAEAFRPARKGVRKVVVATNIAETSVTVPGVRFVIDPGYVKQKTYDPTRRMESLVIVPISQVAAQQRAGRAGRTAPGQCYRLFSRDCYGAMLPETIPEILRTNLANTLLYLKVLGVDDVLAFDFLDPPADDQALEALQHLYCLGALDQNGHATDIGRRMSRFPLEPSLSRTLLEAVDLGCLEEVLTIVALLSVESIWFSRSRGSGGASGGGRGGNHGHDRAGEKDGEADASHALFRHNLGDHFTYLAVYRAWEAGGFSDAWAKDAFLRVRALRTARSVRAQLLGEVRKANGREGGKGKDAVRSHTDITSCGRDLDKVRKAFCAGYFMYAGQRCSKEWVYRSLAVEALQREGLETGQSGLTLMYLHPTSALVHAPEPPEHVIYTELVYTARPFMRHAMVVKGRWLRSRLASVQPVSGDSLCGRVKESKGGLDQADGDEGAGDKGARDVEATSTKESEGQLATKKDGAVAAARARFLARKRKQR